MAEDNCNPYDLHPELTPSLESTATMVYASLRRQGMNASAIHRRAPIAPDTAVLGATILVAPQLFGGSFPWSVVAIAALALVSFGAALWVRRADATPVFDGLFAVMGIAWLWTCIQVLPVPAGIARALDLASVQSAERLEGLAWAGPTALTVSYEPGATYLQILIGIGILSAFLAARLGGASGLRPIALATVASSVLVGLVGVAHEMSGSRVLFGVYEPRFTSIRLLAPLMNSNHLAGFSLLGALIAAGLAASSRERKARIPWILASIFCTCVLAWTLSRGGIGALLFGALVLAAWLLRRSGSSSRGATIPGAVIIATVAGISAFAGLEPILRRFETEGYDKVEVALRGFGLLQGPVWALGVGRGAFSSAFVTHEGLADRYTHPENLVVQWTTEWGLPLALLLLVVLAWALWKRFRAAEEPLLAAVCIALFALGLQNLVDFSLEMAGVVVVVAALLGAALPARGAAHGRRAHATLIGAFGVFLAVLTALGPRVLQSDTQSIVDRLTRYIQVDDEARFEATLRRGLMLHPGEPALALLAGAYAGSKRHPDAARWLSIVMDEAPDWAAPHSIAAGWLAAEGRTDQALLEIREAESRRPGSAREVLCELLLESPQMEHVERAAPDLDQRAAFLNRVATACGRLPPELRATIDAAILKDEPTHPGAALREARRLSGSERTDEAIDLLEGAVRSNPDDVSLWLAIIRGHLQAGNAVAARSVLERASSQQLDARSMSEAKARVEAGLGETEAMRATLTQLRGRAAGDPSLIARSFVLEGELEASLGNVDAALAAYEAADAASSVVPALQHAARLALDSGRPSHARRIYQVLCRRDPGGSACTQEALLSKTAREPPGADPVP